MRVYKKLLGLTYLQENKGGPIQNYRGFWTRLFSSHAYFRDILFQTFHEILGTIFQNSSFVLANFNVFKLYLCFNYTF